MPVRNDPDPDIELLKREKSGCFGAVWRGRQKNLARNVAIKIIHPSMAAATDILNHARGIARAGGHLNIVTVHALTSIHHPDTGELVDAVVMEWLDGDSLASKLRGTPLPDKRALNVCEELCNAVDHIHSQGLAHGDLHAGNVMFSREVLKVIDIDYSEPKSFALLTTATKEQLLEKDVASVGFIAALVLQRSTLSAEIVAQFDQQLRGATSIIEIRRLLKEVAAHPAERASAPPVAANHISRPLPTDRVIESIQSERVNRRALIRQFMQHVVEQLVEIAPLHCKDVEWDDAFVDAVERSIPITAACARVSNEIGAMHDSVAAEAMYKSFGHFLERFESDGPGSYYETDFDFYKFAAHEVFVGLFAALIREELFLLISSLLSTGIYSPRRNSGELRDFSSISEYVKTFDIRNQRLQLRRVSLHADFLNARYTASELASQFSLREFVDADYILLLRDHDWRPWSALYLKGTPRFLVEAVNVRYAEMICTAVGATSREELLSRIGERNAILSGIFRKTFWHSPIDFDDLRRIGTL